MTTQNEKAERFRALHEREGAFIIPNPWDIGSARLLTGLGFEALATTSAGFANSLGRVDGQVTLDELMEHCRALCEATDLPVSADLENCFAHDPSEAAKTIRLAANTGLVGGSIEDYSGDPSKPIYDFDLAVERVHAAAEAARLLDFKIYINCACREPSPRIVMTLMIQFVAYRHLKPREQMSFLRRALSTLDEVRLVTSALNKPVNVLASLLKGATVAQLADAGAKRISIGSSLSRAAMTALIRAGIEMRDQGSFGWTTDLVSGDGCGKVLDRKPQSQILTIRNNNDQFHK